MPGAENDADPKAQFQAKSTKKKIEKIK